MTSAPTTNVPAVVPHGTASEPPPGPTRGGSAPSTIAGSIPNARSLVGPLFHGTPGRMRLLGLLAVIAAIALGAVSVNALLASKAAVERAANNTGQVVRAQSLHVELLRADAIATNAFLVGGLESPASRAQYQGAMANVARNLSEAAASQPADGDALGQLSTQVQQYAALVEQARSNNRLGLPVGAQYLKEASAGLRADAIPIVSAVVEENEKRAQREFAASNTSLWLAVGVLSIATLVGVAMWLARRTHRYLSPSLTGAIVLLLAGLVLASVTIGSNSQATQQVADGDYKRTVALADVRTFANDARANESLTLIARGSGSANEKAWQASDQKVTQTLGDDNDRSGLEAQWTDYRSAHVAVRKLDDGGNWDAAVKAATATGANTASARFTDFDASVTKARDEASQRAVNTLVSLGGSAPWVALGVGLASLVASWLVVRGIGQRLGEYR